MGKGDIPQFQRQEDGTRIYTPRVDTHVPQMDYSGFSDLGRGLQQAAGAASQAEQFKQGKLKEKQDKFDKQQALRVFSEYQIADQKRQIEFKNNYQGDLSKFADLDRQSQSEFYEKFTTEPITDGAREQLTGLYQQYQVKTTEEAFAFQVAATGAKVRQDFEKTANNFINDTRTNAYTNFWPNQEKLNELAETFRGQLPDTVIDGIKKDYKDKNAIAMIRGKGDKDPRTVIKEWKNGVYNKILSPEAIESVMPAMMREIEQEDRQKAQMMRADIMGKLDDHFASLMQTNTPVLSRDQVKIVAELSNDPSLLEDYDFKTKVANKYFSVLKGAEGKSAEEQLAMVEDLKPKPGSASYASEEQVYEALKSEVIKNHKDFLEDPYLATLQNNQVRQLEGPGQRRASLNLQMNKGLPFHKLRVASNDEVKEQAEQVNLLLNANEWDKAKQYMQSLQEEYDVATLPDNRTGWDVFMNQMGNIKEGGVPSDFLMALQYSDSPQGNEIWQAYKVSLNDYKAIIGDTVFSKQLGPAIDSQFGAYARVVSKIPGFNGTGQLAQEKTLLTKYAARLVQQGITPNVAAQRAFKSMYPYNIINSPKEQLRLMDRVNGVKINPSTVQGNLSVLRNQDLIYNHLSKGVSAGGAASVGRVKLSIKDNTGGGALYLRADAAQSLENIQPQVKKFNGVGIQINSAGRTHAEQAHLYANRKNNPYPVAPPGTSKHESDLAIDVNNWKDKRVQQYLKANGWVQSDPKDDPIHWEYRGGKYMAGGLPKSLATETERRLEADKLSKDGVWISSPDGYSVSLYKPNRDGSLTQAYNGEGKAYTYSLVQLQNGKFSSPKTVIKTTKKAPVTSGYVQEKRAQNVRKTASQMAGRPVVRDDEAKFILERGF